MANFNALQQAKDLFNKVKAATQPVQSAVGNAVRPVLRNIGQAEVNAERNVPLYGQFQAGVRNTVAPIMRNFTTPQQVQRYQSFNQPNRSGIAGNVAQFAGGQVPYVPLMIATAGVTNPITSRIASAIPAGKTIGAAALSGAAKQAVNFAPYGWMGGLNYAKTGDERVRNIGESTLSNIALGGGLGAVGGVGKYALNAVMKAFPKATPEVQKAITAAYARDLQTGRFTAAQTSGKGKLAVQNWVRQQVGKKPGQPVFHSDLQEAISKNIPQPGLSMKMVDSSKLPSLPIGQGAEATSTENPLTAEQTFITALKGAKPIRAKQEALYSAERSKRIGAVQAVGQDIRGEQGYHAQLSQLKGQLPKANFEGIRSQIKQPQIDELFNKIEDSHVTAFEKITAKNGLSRLLGYEGGIVPTKGELNLLGEIFSPEFTQAILQKRPLIQRLFHIGTDALNVPRSMMATADLSAPLRQGIFLIGRPKQWLPAFRDQFKYAFSEKAYHGLEENIRSRPTYHLMREGKLAITDLGSNFNSREETFMSNLAEKIPVFGPIARGSNRAYSGFLNKLRADTFDDLVGKAKSQGVNLEGKALEDLAGFINAATGRGNYPKVIARAAPILNGLFFSPRLIASRLNLLNPVYYARLDPFARKEALKSFLSFGATAGTVLGLAKMGGAQVGTDPRSADFGKIKLGNTRYDVLGGFQQYIKLAAQLLSGQVVSSQTGKVITLGEGYKPLTHKDILLRFFEGKESPIASFISTLLTGQQPVTGKPIDLSSEVMSRFIPLVTQDIYNLAREKGDIGQALAWSIPGVFGVGSQTYGKTELVKGTNLIGQPTSQIRQTPGMTDILSEKMFGKQPLGSSQRFNVETYVDQLDKMPRAQAADKFDEIKKSNPDLAKQLVQVIKDRRMGVTVSDQSMKTRGVASGERAQSIFNELNGLKSKEEKAKLWDHYAKIGVLTSPVIKQLKFLISKNQTK